MAICASVSSSLEENLTGFITERGGREAPSDSLKDQDIHLKSALKDLNRQNETSGCLMQ